MFCRGDRAVRVVAVRGERVKAQDTMTAEEQAAWERAVADGSLFVHCVGEPTTLTKGQCADCGAPVDKRARRCASCNTVPLSCDTCGVLFQRQRRDVMNKAKDDRYQAVYCSRACFYVGEKGKPIPQNRRPLVHGTNAGYGRCKPPCDACRAAAAAYTRDRRSRNREKYLARRRELYASRKAARL